MTSHDPRIDAYIANSGNFAQPILKYLRATVHMACPDVEEGIKWSRPFFSYRSSPLCMMAAFKQYCRFGFWLSGQVVGETAEDGNGQFGKIVSIKDLPPKKDLAAYTKKAMALNEVGVKLARPKAGPKPTPALPDDLAVLLRQKKHAAARKTYEGFGPGAQREYVDWINQAKTDTTRQKRLTDTLTWLAEGKVRDWKYLKC